MGTQRIGASAKQAVKKVQKAAPKPVGGTTKFSSPPKPKAAGLPGTGLFGTQRISPGDPLAWPAPLCRLDLLQSCCG